MIVHIGTHLVPSISWQACKTCRTTRHDPLLAAVLQSRTAKDVIRRLKYRFACEGQADVEEDPTCYDWLAAGDHCFHLFGCAVGEHTSHNMLHVAASLLAWAFCL